VPPTALLLIVLSAAISAIVVTRISVRRWIRWAQLAAEFGSRDILHAPDIDSDDAVARLRAQFDAWSTIVRDGAARFCRDDDALRVQFFTPPELPRYDAFNAEHRYIRHATAERVRRLLELAGRLERGDAHLRYRWVPRVN